MDTIKKNGREVMKKHQVEPYTILICTQRFFTVLLRYVCRDRWKNINQVESNGFKREKYASRKLYLR
jgi:hypothetical protein